MSEASLYWLADMMLLLVALLLWAALQRRLKARHAGVWWKLNAPEIEKSRVILSDADLFIFFVYRRYRLLSDPTLTALGDALLLACFFFLLLAIYSGLVIGSPI